MDVDSWIAEQSDQARSDFTRGGTGQHGTVLVGDGDAYDDFVPIGTNRMNTKKPSRWRDAAPPNARFLWSLGGNP